MPTRALISDSMLLAGLALLIALITIVWRRDLRLAMIRWVLVIFAGIAGLWLLERFGGAREQETLAVVLREVTLLILAIGIARITLLFVFEGLLARFGVPHILDDVLTVLTLIVFALYRMNVAGVNLTSIITTSAIISGVIAFSLQESLGNLWGGIALQLDNTCRIGDWIRVDKVTGKIVGIRWRYVAIATNEDETILLPNSALIKQNVTVLGRRGDLYVPWRRKIEFTVAYDVPPSRVIAVVCDAKDRRFNHMTPPIGGWVGRVERHGGGTPVAGCWRWGRSRGGRRESDDNGDGWWRWARLPPATSLRASHDDLVTR